MSSYMLAARNDLDYIDRKIIEIALECTDKELQQKLMHLRKEYYEKLMDTQIDHLENFKRVASGIHGSKIDFNALYEKIIIG